jgi:hypothetical protein
MKKTEFQPKHTLTLEVRTESGRCSVAIDLSFMTARERRALFAVVQRPQGGESIGFSMQPFEGGDQKVAITFTLPNPLAATLGGKVRQALMN